MLTKVFVWLAQNVRSALTHFTREPSIKLSISTSLTGWTKVNEDFRLDRMTFTDKSTVGELWLDGKQFCYTLEPTCRNINEKNKGAIPAGRYQIVMTYSNKFGCMMPELVDVPGFTDIRMHPGNMAEDTEGCILVGETESTDFVGQSRAAFKRLLPYINGRTRDNMLFISIIGGRT